MSSPSLPAPKAAAAAPVAAAVGGLAAFSLGLGLWQVVAPQSFHDAVGPFGTPNAHYVRDYATWSLAYGLLLLGALRRPSWVVPLLALGIVQFALHTMNHIADAGKADPRWVGVFDAVALGVAALGLVAVLRSAAREEAGR